MKNFSIDRFWNVARWDLTVNRTFYLRVTMAVAACVLVPVMGKYALNWGLNIGWGSAPSDRLGLISFFVTILYPFVYTILMGYMFHNLLTRQGRINEFTLPATNLERFVWHFLRIVVGYNIVFLLSLMMADILHVPLAFLQGVRSFNSLTYEVIDFWTLQQRFMEEFELTDTWFMSVFSLLITCCHLSFFALVNAWKYRYNIPLAYLFNVVLGFVGTLLLGVFMVSSLKGMNVLEMEDFAMAIHENWPFISVFIQIGLLLLLAAIWWLTYRLYCRAQITTKRNP